MDEFEKVTTGMGEECGVFGAYDMDGGDVAPSVYYGLFALQHRGQESCGIAVTDTNGERKVHSRKGLGVSCGSEGESWRRPCTVFYGRRHPGGKRHAAGLKLCERNAGYRAQRESDQCGRAEA